MEQPKKKEESTLPKMEGSRTTPFNDLDLTFLTTEPAWGKESNAELFRATSKAVEESYYESIEGNKILVIDKKPLWGLLTYYTRDLRLGNLSTHLGGETDYCQYWLDIAGDLLKEGFVESFLLALSRVITVLEISQSKKGFLRRRHGTITTEKHDSGPAERKLLGGQKEEK